MSPVAEAKLFHQGALTSERECGGNAYVEGVRTCARMRERAKSRKQMLHDNVGPVSHHHRHHRHDGRSVRELVRERSRGERCGILRGTGRRRERREG